MKLSSLGCTIRQLWSHISCSSPQYPLDIYTKPFIWKQLLLVMTEEEEEEGEKVPTNKISLYRLPTPRPPAAPSGSQDYCPLPCPCAIVGGEGVKVRGSCASYADREDVTTSVLREQLQLEQVEERSGVATLGKHPLNFNLFSLTPFQQGFRIAWFWWPARSCVMPPCLLVTWTLPWRH